MKNDKKIVLFGGGKFGRIVYNRLQKDVIAVIDNDSQKWGKEFAPGVSIISLEEYIETYLKEADILICIKQASEIVEQMKKERIYNYSIASEIWNDLEVKKDQDIAHKNWPGYLKYLCDKPNMEVLEIGSRRITGYKNYFEYANYTGFDYYEGENVDVVGDVHSLSQYFDKKFDLIFSSATFEHLAMPWQAALEIIKCLKPGGYVFVETHYSFSSHGRPWHFFQFSDIALSILFSEKFGIECIKKGCDNLLEGYFSKEADEDLQGKIVDGLYCHSEFLGQKTREVPSEELNWSNIRLEEVVAGSEYPH